MKPIELRIHGTPHGKPGQAGQVNANERESSRQQENEGKNRRKQRRLCEIIVKPQTSGLKKKSWQLWQLRDFGSLFIVPDHPFGDAAGFFRSLALDSYEVDYFHTLPEVSERLKGKARPDADAGTHRRDKTELV